MQARISVLLPTYNCEATVADTLASVKWAKQLKVFHSLPQARDEASDYQVMLTTLGQLWSEGAQVDWAGFRAHDGCRRVPLPSYPFERERHWIEPGSHAFGAVPQPASSPSPNWFYDIVWKPAPLAKVTELGEKSRWLIFSDGLLGAQIEERLKATGQQVVTVKVGSRFARLENGEYTVHPGRREDYAALVSDLAARDRVPLKILHLWALNSPSGLDSLSECENLSFYSLLFLAQAFGARDLGPYCLGVVSNSMQQVNGEAVLHPQSAMLLGPCRVIPREYPGTTCQSIDILLPNELAAQQIVAELAASSSESTVAFRGNQWWVPAFEPKRMETGPSRRRPKEDGVYLITGGLGGIGLVIAEYLAKNFHARLVLIGRTALPARADWDSFLHTHASEDPLSEKIRKVRELEKSGAEVLVVSADVASYEQMREVIAQTRQRFGMLDGVFHAAGVLDDGLIQLKTRASAQRVLEPKVKGTLVLDAVLGDTKLDFLVLFSSISALMPPVGQVDYAAANAFLNAFAGAKALQGDRPATAISWGLWREVGMGALAHGQNRSTPPTHPLVGVRISDSPHEIVYSGRYSCDKHWILNEHRFRGGEALFSGTGYMEMAVAAMHGLQDWPVEFRDVLFIAPLTVGSNETREVRIRLKRDPNALRFSVVTKPEGSDHWQEFASGRARHLTGGMPGTSNWSEIAARCNSREITFDNQRTKQEKYFEFGSRWTSLKKICVGNGEALAFLELGDEFQSDLETYRIHPAVLDLATGSALYLIRDYESSEDMYLPFSYERLTIWRPLTATCYSHIRCRDAGGQQGIAAFDITILDEAGRPLIDIEGFALRRIDHPGAFIAGAGRTSGAATRNIPLSSEMNLVERQLKEGLSCAEGAEALLRILSTANAGPNVIVSRLDPGTFSERAQQPNRVLRAAATSNQPAPRDDVERKLAAWWTELLGFERVGIHDDFFELGGHSLIAARLFTLIKKTYDVDLGLATLFEARNIERLAGLIRTARTDALARPWTSLVPIQPEGSRPPIYFIGGWGGNVLTFETIARYMGPGQPVYGLQSQGLDGKQPLLTRMEDIARNYLPAIRSVQPHGPYYLGGYSFGGVVAFEMAQQLRAQGEVVGMVAFIDTIEWRYWNRAPTPLARLEIYKLRLRRLFLQPGKLNYLKNRLRVARLKALNVLYKLRGSPGIPPVATVVEANWLAAARYVPRFYPGRITLLRCSERDLRDRDDYLLGWGGLAAGVDVVDVPGHHLTITKEPNVQVLAQKLRDCLENAQAGNSLEREIEALTPR